jgi:hypothetical protein
MKKILILLIAVAQLGCSLKPDKTAEATKTPPKPLIVFDNKDDGWGGDIRLSLVGLSENDTAKIYKAVSSTEKGNLGVLVLVTKKPADSKGFGNAITLKSLGPESDLMLQKLAELYKQKIDANAKFVKTAQATFVDLGAFARSLGGTTNGDENVDQYKLFFETKNDEGELFMNINTNENWLELREKDEDYRPVLIKAFTQ